MASLEKFERRKNCKSLAILATESPLKIASKQKSALLKFFYGFYDALFSCFFKDFITYPSLVSVYHARFDNSTVNWSIVFQIFQVFASEAPWQSTGFCGARIVNKKIVIVAIFSSWQKVWRIFIRRFDSVFRVSLDHSYSFRSKNKEKF